MNRLPNQTCPFCGCECRATDCEVCGCELPPIDLDEICRGSDSLETLEGDD